MIVRIKELQEWCNQNLSPMAWQRVAIQLYGYLRESGWTLEALQSPTDDACLEGETFDLACEVIEMLYAVRPSLEELKN